MKEEAILAHERDLSEEEVAAELFNRFYNIFWKLYEQQESERSPGSSSQQLGVAAVKSYSYIIENIWGSSMEDYEASNYNLVGNPRVQASHIHYAGSAEIGIVFDCLMESGEIVTQGAFLNSTKSGFSLSGVTRLTNSKNSRTLHGARNLNNCPSRDISKFLEVVEGSIDTSFSVQEMTSEA